MPSKWWKATWNALKICKSGPSFVGRTGNAKVLQGRGLLNCSNLCPWYFANELSVILALLQHKSSHVPHNYMSSQIAFGTLESRGYCPCSFSGEAWQS